MTNDLVGRRCQDGFRGCYQFRGKEKCLYFNEKWKILALTLWDGGDYSEQLIAGDEPVTTLDDVEEAVLWTPCAVFVWWISDCGMFCLFPSPDAVSEFREQNSRGPLQCYAFFLKFWEINPGKFHEYKIRQIFLGGKAGFHHDQVFGPMRRAINDKTYLEQGYLSDTKNNRSSRHRRIHPDDQEDVEAVSRPKQLVLAVANPPTRVGIPPGPTDPSFCDLPNSDNMMFGNGDMAGSQKGEASSSSGAGKDDSCLHLQMPDAAGTPSTGVKPLTPAIPNGGRFPSQKMCGSVTHSIQHPGEPQQQSQMHEQEGQKMVSMLGGPCGQVPPAASSSSSHPADGESPGRAVKPCWSSGLRQEPPAQFSQQMSMPPRVLPAQQEQHRTVHLSEGSSKDVSELRGLYGMSQQALNNPNISAVAGLPLARSASFPAGYPFENSSTPQELNPAGGWPAVHHPSSTNLTAQQQVNYFAHQQHHQQQFATMQTSASFTSSPAHSHTSYHPQTPSTAQSSLRGSSFRSDDTRTPTAPASIGGLPRSHAVQSLVPRALNHNFGSYVDHGDASHLESLIGQAVEKAVSTVMENFLERAVSTVREGFDTTMESAKKSMDEHAREMRNLTTELKRQQDEKVQMDEMMLSASRISYAKFNLPCKSREDLFAFYQKVDAAILGELELLIYAKWFPKSSTGTFGVVNETLKALLHPMTMFFQVYHEKDCKAGGPHLDSSAGLNIQRYRADKRLKIPLHEMAFIRILFTNVTERARKGVPNVVDKLQSKDWTYVQQINSYMRTHRGKIRDERHEIKEKEALRAKESYQRPKYSDDSSTVAQDEIEDDLLNWYEAQVQKGTINQNWRIVKAQKRNGDLYQSNGNILPAGE